MPFRTYRVVGSVAHIGTGVRLAISDAQLRRRAHNVEVIDKAAGGAVVRSKAPLQFKRGEIIGLEELSPHLATIVAPVEDRTAKAAGTQSAPGKKSG